MLSVYFSVDNPEVIVNILGGKTIIKRRCNVHVDARELTVCHNTPHGLDTFFHTK